MSHTAAMFFDWLSLVGIFGSQSFFVRRGRYDANDLASDRIDFSYR
jgi:hypothetical protein